MSAPGVERIDLLSDTVTLPPPGMRTAIASAPVGDDVYGEDPSVNRLEGRAADLLGKDAAVLVPSGTMANLLSLMAHCARGEKVLVGDASDVWCWEAGGGAVLGGLVYAPIPTLAGGELDEGALERATDGAQDPQCAVARLVCLENTHCLSGGRVLPAAYVARVSAWARRHGLRLHLDGARLWNAALAAGRTVAELAAPFDSVCVSLSKGLSAPVGSLIAGDSAFAGRVRRLRKMVGGGMRQAGFLAAAGLYALDHMVERLADDHAHARRLWAGLRAIPELRCDDQPPHTNIVFFELREGHRPADFLADLEAEGVRMGELGRGRLRAVLHYGIEREHVDRALEAVARVAARRFAGVPQGGGARRASG